MFIIKLQLLYAVQFHMKTSNFNYIKIYIVTFITKVNNLRQSVTLKNQKYRAKNTNKQINN